MVLLLLWNDLLVSFYSKRDVENDLEIRMMLLYDGTGTHALLQKRKAKRKNIALDFPIIFENWLSLWKN